MKGFKRAFRRLLQNVSRTPDRGFDLLKRVERATGIEPAWPAWKAGPVVLFALVDGPMEGSGRPA